MSFPRYPKYKASGVEWLSDVPEHWEVKKVSHIADLIAGFAFPSEQFGFDPESGIPLVRGDNVTEGWLRWGEKGRYWPFGLEYDARYLLDANDIVIQMDGSKVGKNWAFVGKDDLPALLVQRVTRVRVNAASPRFIYSLFANEMFVRYVDRAKTDPAIPHITMRNIGDYWVPLPPSNEQTKIASFFDRETLKIDGLVGEQRRLIELLKEKRQAVISHAVTKGLNPHAPLTPSGIEWLGDVPEHWEVRRLKFLCDTQTGDKDTENAIEDGQYPFFVRSQTVERINSATFDCEAILTAGDGVGVGKVFHYHNGPFDFHQRVYMMNNFREVSGPFLFHFLRENFYKVALEGGAKSTVDSLRRPVFMNFTVCVPSSAEQTAIVEMVEYESTKFDALTAEAERGIELLQERRTALISAAVTGQIDVRGLVETEAV